MNWRRLGLVAALALMLVALRPAGALAHDDYDDQLFTHPFQLAAMPIYTLGFAVDQLVARPIHWMVNNEPLETVTGHDKLSTRTPPDSLEDMR